jgi:hypothetical protein
VTVQKYTVIHLTFNQKVTIMANQELVFGQPVGDNVAPINGTQNKRGSGRAVGAYINIALPRTDGTDGKIDRGLRLYLDDEAQVNLANALQTPEGLAAFKEKLIVSCNIVTTEKAGFDLGLPAPKAAK